MVLLNETRKQIGGVNGSVCHCRPFKHLLATRTWSRSAATYSASLATWLLATLGQGKQLLVQRFKLEVLLLLILGIWHLFCLLHRHYLLDNSHDIRIVKKNFCSYLQSSLFGGLVRHKSVHTITHIWKSQWQVCFDIVNTKQQVWSTFAIAFSLFNQRQVCCCVIYFIYSMWMSYKSTPKNFLKKKKNYNKINWMTVEPKQYTVSQSYQQHQPMILNISKLI